MDTRTTASVPHAEYFPTAPAPGPAWAWLRSVRDDLDELRRFWPVVHNMVSQELRVRYQRSALGFFWSLLNPILMMAVMTVVFSRFLARGQPWQEYCLHLFAGQTPWLLLAGSLTESALCILVNEGLIRKIYVPKAIFPITRVLVNLVNTGLALVALFVLLIPLGARPSWAMLALPLLIGLFTLFTLGLALALAALNTFFRDVGHLIGVFLQAWYFATPILYDPSKMLDASGHPLPRPWFLRFNPACPFIEQFQAILGGGRWPTAGGLAWSVALAFASLGIGYAVFKSCQDKLVFRL